MPRHPADRGPSSWSRHGDARQLLSVQQPHARSSSDRLWSGSDTEEEEGTSIKYLTASTDATASCCSPASVWIHVVDSAEEIHAADVNHPICGHLQLGNEAGLCDARVGEERSLRHR